MWDGKLAGFVPGFTPVRAGAVLAGWTPDSATDDGRVSALGLQSSSKHSAAMEAVRVMAVAEKR